MGCPACRDGFDQHFLRINRLAAIGEGQFVLVTQDNGFGGTGIFAETAEDAAQHVDLVGAGIAIAGRETFLVRILGRFDKDGIRRAGCRAQRTADAFFQTIIVALQDMPPTEARL